MSDAAFSCFLAGSGTPKKQQGKSMDGVTDESRKRLGDFLWHCALQAGFTSQEQLAKYVSEKSHIYVNESAINTIVGARWKRSFNFTHMMAIIDSDVLKFADGRSLDYNDVMETLRGRLDPFTQERLGNGSEKPA